jgi:hypothetical protein
MSAATSHASAAAAPAAMSRAASLAALLGLLLAMASISVLHARGQLPTSFFATADALPDGPFDLQLLAMFAGVALLQIVPARFARAVVFAEGVVCLAAYGVEGLYFAAALLAWFGLLEVPLPRRARLALPLAALVGTGVLGSLHVLPWAYRFSILFSMRLVMVTWDKWQHDWPRGRFSDYALYLLSPPLLVHPPYVVIIPFYERHGAAFAPRLTSERARRAIGQLGTGLAAHLVYWLVRWQVGVPHGVVLRCAVDYVLFILAVARVAHIAYGLLLFHGFDDRPPIRAPLLATDFVEMWNRFQAHQKDMQVALFFTPVLIRLRRANRYVAILAATAMTMFVGNLFIHFLVRYVYSLETVTRRLLPLYEFFLVSFVVLSVTLSLQEWRRRTKRKPRRGALGLAYTLGCWAATQALVATLLSL